MSFKRKCQLQITEEKVEVFSKVGPMKNVEKSHNFKLIYGGFFCLWFKRMFCGVLYLVFGSVKGHFLK